MPPRLPAPDRLPRAPTPALPARRPRLALALGGGGARGLAHLLVLEAFDELGIKPDIIAGTSIGAIYGAAYASGLPAKLIRAHTEDVLGQRFDLVRQLFSARAEPVLKILSIIPMRAALLDAQALMEVVLPGKVARDFADLAIPLRIVATDFYAQEPAVFASGALRPAVAASMALPALFTPVTIAGRSFVDGGLVNPLPFDIIADDADVTIAIDVSGNPPGNARADAMRPQPTAIEVLMSSSQIFQRSIVREKLRARQPDIYIDCPVDNFSVIDFHRFKAVLEAAAPVKDRLKRQLSRILDSQPAETLALPARAQPQPQPQLKGKRRRARPATQCE